MKFGLTLAVILAISVVAQAAVTVEVINKGAPNATYPSLTKYWVILHAGAGDKVSGWDGGFTTVAGSGMVQQWAGAGYGYEAESETSWAGSMGMAGTVVSAAAKQADSRLLVSSAAMLMTKAPWEDNSAGIAGGQGFGTKLAGAVTHLVNDIDLGDVPVFDSWTTMAFGIKAANQVQDLLLAQIILADGQTGVQMDGAATAAVATGAFATSALIGIPEPATMGLIAAGALALIRRRR